MIPLDFDMQLEEFDDLFDLSPTEDNTLGGEEIAVVGLSVMAGHAHDATEVWGALCRGDNFVRAFPEARRADADAFAAFVETGDILNPEVAQRYLHLLEQGGTRDAALLYQEFRGKDADAKHHMKRCGF